MAWQKVRISYFLKERQDRIKPDVANKMGLNRLEKINFSGKIFINENKPTRTGMIFVKKGDLVISGINVEKGALAVYQGNEDLLATIHYSSYSYDKTKIDIEFLKWFLKSDAFKQALLSQTKGGIKTELKPKKFLPLEIDLPDLATQIKIRNKLNSVTNEIGEVVGIQNDNANYLSKLRQAILSEAVSGKLVPQDPNDEPAYVLLEKIKSEKEKLIKEKKIRKEKPLPPITEEEIPFTIPNSWKFVRLGNCVSILGDGIHGTPNYTINGEYYFINGNNLNDGVIVLKNNTKQVSKQEYENHKKNLNDRTILVSINGTIGNVAFYNNEKVMLGKSACYFNLFNELDMNYIKYLIKTNYFLDYAINSATGTTIKNVSLKAMRMLKIPLPPLNEQKRIVEKVNQLMKLCDELESQIKENQKNSEALMNAVLREAFEV